MYHTEARTSQLIMDGLVTCTQSQSMGNSTDVQHLDTFAYCNGRVGLRPSETAFDQGQITMTATLSCSLIVPQHIPSTPDTCRIPGL